MRMTSQLALSTALTAAFTTTAGAASVEDDPWALLSLVQVDEVVTDSSYEVKKVFPKALEAGIRDFFITGYAMPLTPPGEGVRELILTSDMGDCPFCGSPDHGVTLQVQLDSPIVIEEGARISLVGALEAVTDPETWQAAIMKNARVVES